MGFTLIELLVVMAILSIMLLAITQMQGTTLAASNTLVGQANRMRELQEASGYLSDRIRSARAIQTDPSLTINGGLCMMSSTTAPCFAALVGEVRAGSTAVYGANVYMYVVYKMIPRSEVPAVDRKEDEWADTGTNTMSLVEYRQVVCEPQAYPAGSTTPGQCTTVSPAPTGYVTIPTSVPLVLPTLGNSMTMNVILDYATLDDASGAFTPFATGDIFTIKLRAKNRVNNNVRYTPISGPFTLKVKPRN